MSALAVWAAGIGVVQSFVNRLTTYLTAVAVAVAVLFVAINGIRFLASNGSPHRQADAKSGLVAACVGLAITLSAGLVIALVVGALR